MLLISYRPFNFYFNKLYLINMYKRLIILAFFVAISFTSCVDIEERYDFAANGSCKVIYGFDMSRAVSVFMNLLSDSVKSTPQFALVKDTTLNFYSTLPDSTQRKLGAEETAMAMNSDLSVKMDLKNNMMNVTIGYLAKTPDDLQYYLNHLSKLSVNGQLNNITGKTPQTGLKDQSILTAGQDYYSYKVTPDKFMRIIDKDKFRAFLKKTQSALSAAKAMLVDMPYKVVLNFARPVKKVDNPKATLSADRKQLILSATIDDIIKDPAVMNLSVDF